MSVEALTRKPRGREVVCELIAETYHIAVVLFGQGFYEATQEKRKKYEQSDTCMQTQQANADNLLQ